MKKLLIIDGNAMIMRSLMTKPDQVLASPAGEPTWGTYFFVKKLFATLREDRWDAVVWAKDCSRADNFRKQIYPAYKEGRSPLPDELLIQRTRCDMLLDLLKIPMLLHPNAEADDLIGAFVKQWAPHASVTVAGRDKDLMCLAGEPNTTIWCPFDKKVWWPDDVRLKWQVNPSQMPIFLALCGDSSDGIPGVTGVGAVTAARIIREVGDTLEAIRAGAPNVRGKVGEHLRAALADGSLERWLALTTLRTDIAMPDELVPCEPDHDAVAPVFEELGFRGFLR